MPNVPDRSIIVAALQLAARAPSVHNTQPWQWEFDGTRLQLSSDSDRQLTVADPSGRQEVISCGAMLHHSRIAFAAQGYPITVHYSPEESRHDLLAVAEFDTPRPPSNRERALAAAIRERRSDRLPMSPPDRPELIGQLAEVVTDPRVHLDAIADEVRPRLAAASRQTAAMHQYDTPYQTELRWWTGSFDLAEGIPPAALATAREAALVDVGRDFPVPPGAPHRAEAPDHATLVALSTAANSEPDWLATGEALSTTLLSATAAGLATCPLTHITEIPAALRAIGALLPDPDRIPQVLIRLGTAPHDYVAPPTPRRSPEDFLTFTDR
ncbi:hypothetical protein NONO_c08030 [Nocardia nova SH22a]|uniref:Nitroreductase family protein n=1 Tax=Nocardia nova SH22a TaxID=1415166 RepID=W5T8F2_9NOCA|nr:hypothetical protein [Nocardia nova]AHH15610.1 hypothetical protein NONO_c08030 [Nocardia nova SH22a]